MGAEDEVFVAEEGHGDADGLGRDGGKDDGEGKVVAWEEMSVEEDEAGVEEIAEDGVGDADEEVADDLGGGQHAAQAGEGPVGRGCCGVVCGTGGRVLIRLL